LVPAKRFDLFLQTLAQLNSKFPVKGVIAGDGPLRNELEAHARRLGLLPGRVEFLGGVSDTVGLYRRASLFLLTSDHEGTPNVVLEAMASGVPVVGTRVGDVPDLLGNGERGRLAERGDLDGLVSAIVELLGDPQTRAHLANHALAYVQSQRSHTALKDHLTKLYSLTLTT
jgi:glycosyltransferase involved in cell wall biosynthesis